jgi:hypothetical protein
MSEQQYKFVDMTGRCFKKFGEVEDSTEYHRCVAAMLIRSDKDDHPFHVGDMMIFKDELMEAGFEWGVDFYVKKI